MSQYTKKPWAHLYSTATWKAIRRQQLSEHPLCLMCQEEGRIRAASICDHIEPHKGDEVKFYAGPFQSLCKPHHDSDKQMLEKSGRRRTRFDLRGRVVW